MKIDEKKINNFFLGLTEAERILLSHQVTISDNFRNFIRKNEIDRDEFMRRFNLKSPERYEQFINGGLGYTIRDMAYLNACSVEIAQNNADKNVIFSVEFVDYKYSKRDKS
jgi:hypothetical protein